MDIENDAHELAHLYVDGAFNRRELVRRAKKIAGGFAAVTVALHGMGVPAKADGCSTIADLTVPADAADLVVADIQFAGPESTLFAHLAKPNRDSTDPLPAVIVIHENRGLTDHIKDVTRRVARAGYIALGIDLLSRQGGTDQFTDPTAQSRAYGLTTPAGRLADMKAGTAYLRTLPDVRSDRIGSVGFCAGGGNVWALAVSGEETVANVVYYGTPIPPPDQMANIKGAMQCHYAELDRNLTASTGTVIPALVNARITFGFIIHEGVGHAFNNDTGAAFNPGVACEAWSETLSFFAAHLNAA